MIYLYKLYNCNKFFVLINVRKLIYIVFPNLTFDLISLRINEFLPCPFSKEAICQTEISYFIIYAMGGITKEVLRNWTFIGHIQIKCFFTSSFNASSFILSPFQDLISSLLFTTCKFFLVVYVRKIRKNFRFVLCVIKRQINTDLKACSYNNKSVTAGTLSEPLSYLV